MSNCSMVEYPKPDTAIIFQSHHTILVECGAEKLRQIADCLERQEQRNNRYREGMISTPELDAALDSINCQLHSGNVSLWFRLPSRIEE